MSGSIENNAIIRLFHVYRRYGRKQALADITLDIAKNSFVYVHGPSGAGKSTFLKLLYLGDSANSGQIIIDGMNVARISKKRMPFLRRHLGIVFQDFKLIPTMTVFHNIALVLEAAGKPKKQIENRVRQMMKLVDILLYEDLYKILGMPDIAERVEYYRQSALEYEEMLEFTAREEGEVLILDLRNEPYIKPANRFVKYALYPKSEYSIQVMWGLRKMNTVFAVGKSIFTEDKSERLNVEEVLKKYGGIARKNSGSLQVASEESEEILKTLIEELNSLL